MKKTIAFILTTLILLGTVGAFAGCSSGPRSTEIIDGHTYRLNQDGQTYTLNIIDSGFSGTEFTVPSTITDAGYKVTALGNNAFNGNTTIEKITLPEGLTIIRGLNDCTALKSINIPSTVTTIDTSAFYGCTALKKIVLPDSVTTIEYQAFSGCSALEEINIPASVTTIGDEAFADCTALTQLPIGIGVTTIGDSAFYGCTKLESIKILENVTTMGNSAFANCSALKSVTLNNKLDTLSNGLFSNCTALVNITIPANVTTIETDALDARFIKTITYGGTMAAFESSGGLELQRRYTVKCSDGTIEPTITPAE